MAATEIDVTDPTMRRSLVVGRVVEMEQQQQQQQEVEVVRNGGGGGGGG